MRHIAPLAAFVFAGLVATSAAEAAGGGKTFPAPQALESDEQPVATPTPREIVNFHGPQRPGTVIINTSERRLYFVLPGQQAIDMRSALGGLDFVGRGRTYRQQARMARLDASEPDDLATPDLPRPWQAASTIRSAPARCISPARSIASMARTSLTRSVKRYHPAAYV